MSGIETADMRSLVPHTRLGPTHSLLIFESVEELSSLPSHLAGWPSYGVTTSEREEITRWYFYHRQEIGYVYGSAKTCKVFLLGFMSSQ